MSLNKQYKTRVCPVCNKTYQANVGRLKHGRQTTCSRKCSYALRGKQMEDKRLFTCDVCGKEFSCIASKKKAQFITACSFDCYSDARKRGLHPQPPHATEKPAITFICETCGKRVELPNKKKGARRFRFCSVECANQGYTGENNYFWRGGHSNYYGSTWTTARRAARIRDNFICQRCGKVMKSGRLPDVHHIKPFRFFNNHKEANKLDNLVSLCHICHLTVEWNGIDFPLNSVTDN